MASIVNIIEFQTDENSRVWYAWEDGKWTKNTETRDVIDTGILETTTVSKTCTPEDVIEAFINGCCREGVQIDVCRRFGTPYGIQLWSKSDPESGPHRLTKSEDSIQLECLRTRVH